jgi:hypothetical protein
MKKRKLKQFELTTTKNAMDMPYPVFAKDRKSALKFIKKRLRKGEKIIKLEKVI